jgi:pyruvate kinase
LRRLRQGSQTETGGLLRVLLVWLGSLPAGANRWQIGLPLLTEPTGRYTPMTLPSHKTKIVCTIGPASASPETLKRMIRAGMNVCRLNFAHGDFESHGESIRLIRDAARAENTRVAILADLPGPKMRMGEIAGGQVTLDNGATVVLSSGPRDNRDNHLPIQFSELPRLVKTGDTIFLNDGFLHLTVEEVGESDIRCRVDVGAS